MLLTSGEVLYWSSCCSLPHCPLWLRTLPSVKLFLVERLITERSIHELSQLQGCRVLEQTALLDMPMLHAPTLVRSIFCCISHFKHVNITCYLKTWRCWYYILNSTLDTSTVHACLLYIFLHHHTYLLHLPPWTCPHNIVHPILDMNILQVYHTCNAHLVHITQYILSWKNLHNMLHLCRLGNVNFTFYLPPWTCPH